MVLLENNVALVAKPIVTALLTIKRHGNLRAKILVASCLWLIPKKLLMSIGIMAVDVTAHK